jgi:hypothetical protein
MVISSLATSRHSGSNGSCMRSRPIRGSIPTTGADWPRERKRKAPEVEIWFSILQAKSLCNESFTSVKQLREHIDNFIDAYNANARPFAWSKSEVHQKRLKARFADQ